VEQGFGPYLEIARIQSEINKMFDVLLEMRQDDTAHELSSWIPSVDVCQNADGLLLRCDLPGVLFDTLKLAAHSGALIITGERHRATAPSNAKFVCVERVSGMFRRVVPLAGAFNTRDAKAVLVDGVLEVFFPKVSNRRGEEVVIPVAVQKGRS
jgi:HSP20 family protein